MAPFREQLSEELVYLYAKSLDEVQEFETTLSNVDLSAREVLRAHFSIAEYFYSEGEGIGGVGDLPLNFHPIGTGALLVDTPIGAG